MMNVYLDSTIVLRQMLGSGDSWEGWGKWGKAYASMLLRGHHQHFHYADIKSFSNRDALYLFGCILVFFLLRTVRVAQLLGGTLVR